MGKGEEEEWRGQDLEPRERGYKWEGVDGSGGGNEVEERREGMTRMIRIWGYYRQGELIPRGGLTRHLWMTFPVGTRRAC